MKIRNIRNRRGLAIAPAVVCLVLVLLITGGLVRQVAILRQETKRKEFRSQANWLLESGLGRAAAKFKADPAYQGETWEITAESMGTSYSGTVLIEVKTSDDASKKDQKTVRVQADYPRGDTAMRQRLSSLMVLAPDSTSKGGLK